MVLLIGGIITIAGLLIAFLTVSFLDSGYGFQASEKAEAVASAGGNDAYLNLIRNSAFANTSGYTVAVTTGSATVTVTQNSPSAGLVSVLSASTIQNRTRKVQAVFSDNPANGQVTLVSWQAVQ